MTAIPLARLVRKMRSLQRICMIPIDDAAMPAIVEDSRKAELAVDRAVKEILGQPTLFDDPRDDRKDD